MAGKKKDKGGLDDQHIKNISMNLDYYRRNPKAKEDYWRNIAKAKHPEADALFDGLVKKSEEEKAATATAAAAAKVEPKPQNEPKKPEPIAPSAKPVETSSSVPTGPSNSVVAKPVTPPVTTKTATIGTSTSTKPVTGTMLVPPSVGTKTAITGTPMSTMSGPGLRAGPNAGPHALDSIIDSQSTRAAGIRDLTLHEGRDTANRGQELVNNEAAWREMPRAYPPDRHNFTSGLWHEVDEDNITSLTSRIDPSTALFPIRSSLQKPTTQLYTNRFEVKIDRGAVLHEFHIVGIPEGRSRRMTRMFMDTAIEQSPVLRDNKDCYATDNLKKIIAWKDLRELFKEKGASGTHMNGWHLVDVKDGDDVIVPLYLQHICVVDTVGLQRYVTSEQAGPGWDPMRWQQEATMEALNIVIAKCFGGNIVRTSPNKFFIEAGWQRLSNSPLCTIRGYYFSARPGMGNILLNVNACTSAFFMPIRLDALMLNGHQLGADYPSVLRGLRVCIRHRRGNTDKAKSSSINKKHSGVKTIDGLGEACEIQTFEFTKYEEDKSKSSKEAKIVADYLKERYNTKLIRPDLPAVNLGSQKDPCWFPPEELWIMPYQIYTRVVPTALTAAMLKVACLDPNDNAMRIEGEAMNRLLLNQDSRPVDLRRVPLRINRQLLKISATKLPYPKIRYGNKAVSVREDSARWNLTGLSFLKTQQCTVSYAFFSDTDVAPSHVGDLQNKFDQHLERCRVGKPQNIDLPVNRIRLDPRNLIDNIRRCLRDAKQRKANLVILVLRNTNQEVYSTFKYLADRVFGISSLVMVAAKNFKNEYWNPSGLDQYIGNIMMKANLKMGGINHSADSQPGNIGTYLKDTLVLGADVTHPSSGAITGCPSVAALVGSIDSTGGQFLGSLSLQSKGKKEIIDDLYAMVKERLSDWCTHNENRLPQKILYYRDGVSDAQLEHVKDEELPQIRAGFNAFVAERQKGPGSNAPSVKITAVVCTKRHHTRFYPKDPSDSQGRPGNCKPGTLVDRSITSPYFTDFYLQSHSGIKGTAKPAHYWVLLNEMEIDTSELQYLTYNLCLSYVRATLGVSYAAPAYYADRLCERARCYLRDFFSPTTAIRRQGEDDRRDAEIREGLWKPKQSDNMTRAEKDKERAQTKEKKDRIEKKMEDDQMRRARRRLGALDGQNRRDQDYDEHAVGQVLKTMYWM